MEDLRRELEQWRHSQLEARKIRMRRAMKYEMEEEEYRGLCEQEGGMGEDDDDDAYRDPGSWADAACFRGAGVNHGPSSAAPLALRH